MTESTTVDIAGPGANSQLPRTILFPDVRLNEVLQFDDELLLGLRATKSWQDPATPAWLGGALSALAAAIGPMVRLFLPDGRTVTPTFNALIAIPPGGSLEFNRRLLTPIRHIQTSTRNRHKIELNTILTSSFKDRELRFQFSRTLNGALVFADEKSTLLHRFLEAGEESQRIIANLLQAYIEPKEINNLAQPMWEGTVHTLMFGHRNRLSELASTPLLHPESYSNVLILSEEFTPYDISPGHDYGYMERKPWNDLIKRVTEFPCFWAIQEIRPINCPIDSAGLIHEFRRELNILLKVVHPTYYPFLAWVPDLAASIAVTICFAGNPDATTIDPETVQHAVIITKWLANCHFKGLQEILQVEPIPDVSDIPAIPDKSRLILEKLQKKGPMTPREISRSCYRMNASVRDQAITWIHERNLVMLREDGLVQALS